MTALRVTWVDSLGLSGDSYVFGADPSNMEEILSYLRARYDKPSFFVDHISYVEDIDPEEYVMVLDGIPSLGENRT